MDQGLSVDARGWISAAMRAVRVVPESMKIAIATGPLFPVPAVAGGAIARMWLLLGTEFARRGHEVQIVARSFPGQASREVVSGVTIVRRGGFDQSRWIFVDLGRNIFYSLGATLRLPESDILVTNDFWIPAISGCLSRKSGAIVVNANRYPKGQYRLYSGVSRIAAASNVVARAVAMEYPLLASRTRVFPNPIDTEVFRPARGERDLGRKSLVFVGRLHPEKGVHTLIEAFSTFAESYPGWCLRLVGPVAENQGGGGARYERKLNALARELPVEFVGPVFDHGELAEILRSATIFCYPSFADKGEALPVAPLEAMACGAAVLVSDLECFRDYIVEGETGFVFDQSAPDPAASLAARLCSLAVQPGALASVGAKASVKAAEFSIPSVAESFLSDFEVLLQQKGRS
jgi:glycosyltransferase involved in cell wall biosynthesis